MTHHTLFSMRARLGALLTLPVLTAALLTGCDPKAGGGGDLSGRKIRVTTTVGMVADTVRNVGGDRVDVTALMGPGVDPHLYKASQGDIQRLSDADIVFYNGLHLEGKMVEVLEKIGEGGKPTVAVAEAIDESKLRNPPEFKGQHDPHVWFDASMWAETITPVVEALSKMDASHAAQYQANGEKYRKELAELDAYCRKQLATIPKERRVLVTAHDAFGYFGRAYEIDVVGLQGISTVSEYGIKDIQDRIDLIAKRKVKAVFVESSVPRRSIEAVVAGCKAAGHTVTIGGTLYSDAMGDPGTPDGTYPGMVRHNVDTIVAALK
jgi:manganese/zinc/iron transport system substrate-binding protein